jgi:hypothetical protein
MEVKSFSQGEAESIFRIYLDDETVEKHRDALLEFAKHVEHLPDRDRGGRRRGAECVGRRAIAPFSGVGRNVDDRTLRV